MVMIMTMIVPVLLLGYLSPHIFHVNLFDLTDKILKRRTGEGPWLRIEDDLVTKHHQGRDGADAKLHCKLLLGLGVNLGEHDAFVLLGRVLEDGSE